MLYLLKYIPPIHHPYFRNIKSSQDVDDVGPLDDDEEIEENNEEN